MNSPNNTDRAAWFQGPNTECPPLTQGSGRPVRLVLLGAPGVGKGTQALLLSQSLGTCHLSTGDLFRAAGGSSPCQQTAAMQEALDYMRRGALVPDGTVWDLVRERKNCLRCNGGFLLDGFPRTLAQATCLAEFLKQESLSLTAVVNYELPLDEIVARLSGRRTCRNCKAIFHVTGQPPKRDGICDHCGGELYQREDDRPESIEVRMDFYQRGTAPLIDFYSRLGLLVSVVAGGTPGAICARTFAALEAAGVIRNEARSLDRRA